MTRHGQAWIALALALGVHVADEAANDFLSVYNPAVRAIRERAPFLPLPTFSFDVWIAGLAAAVVVLLALSRAVFAGRRWTIAASYALGVLMTVNALGHIGVTLAQGRPMPGVDSSPLLLGASLWLLIAARKRAMMIRNPLWRTSSSSS
jgi:hypothetical protein